MSNTSTSLRIPQVSILYMLFGILFCVCLIASNIFETKQLSFFGHSQTCGLLIFPISYIINDVVCEVWGYRKTRLIIWIGFLMNFFVVLFGALCDWLPGAAYWNNDAGFHAIFGLTPRIAIASFMAYILGSFTNAYVMSKMKLIDHGKHFSYRAVMSTVFGEGADSLIFFPIAFWGIIPNSEIPWLMFSQVILKTVYEILVLPITIRIVCLVKKYEQTDTYDNEVSYNIFKVFPL